MRNYLSEKLVSQISSLNIKIEKTGCRQLLLIDASNLAKLTRDNNTSKFNTDSIINLWQLGFIQADVIYSSSLLEMEGLVKFDYKNNCR